MNLYFSFSDTFTFSFSIIVCLLSNWYDVSGIENIENFIQEIFKLTLETISNHFITMKINITQYFMLFNKLFISHEIFCQVLKINIYVF